jgi:hypothetical protein
MSLRKKPIEQTIFSHLARTMTFLLQLRQDRGLQLERAGDVGAEDTWDVHRVFLGYDALAAGSSQAGR